MSDRRKIFNGAVRRSANDAMSVGDLARYFVSREASGGGESELRNPYASVAAVYACIRKKCNSLAMLPMRTSTADDQVVETGPLAELAERPNPAMTGTMMIKTLCAFREIFGRVYLVKQSAGSDGVPAAIVPVSPVEMTETYGGGRVISYTYTPIAYGGGVTMQLQPDEVHPIIDPDFGSGDITRSASPRHAAALAISQHYQADVANNESLRRGAGGGMALSSDRALGDDERKRVLEGMNERHSGPRGRHRWMLLEGALKVEKLFSTFSEMEFTELKYFSREDICVSFEVNPLVLGYSGREGLGSGQHTDAAHLIFWQDVILPLAQTLAQEWDLCVMPGAARDKALSMRDARKRAMTFFESCQRGRRNLSRAARAEGRKFYTWFDDSGVSVIQQAKANMADQIGKWVAMGVPLADAVDAHDLPYPKHPWMETWWRPFGVIDVRHPDEGMPGNGDPTGAPPPPEDSPEDPTTELPAGKTSGGSGGAGGSGGDRAFVPDYIRLLTVAVRDHLWMRWRSSWRALEVRLLSKVTSHQMDMRRLVLARLHREAAGSELRSIRPDQRRDLIGRVLIDFTVDAQQKLVASVRPILREAFRLGGEQAMAEAAAAEGNADQPDPFKLSDPLVSQAMRQREIRISQTDQTLRNHLREQLAQGMEKQETVSEMAERVRKTFNFAGDRARTIAMTETGGAVEAARNEGRRQAHTPAKTWLWSRKETGRPWHMETEELTLREPVPNDQNFTLAQTGASTPYPRGPGLTAEDAANCGCSTLARYPGDKVKDARGLAHVVTRGFLTHEQLRQRDIARSAA